MKLDRRLLSNTTMVSSPVCEMQEFAAYQAKLMSANEAAELVPDRSKLLMPFGPPIPPALCRALAQRAEAGGFTSLDITYCYATEELGRTLLQPHLDVIHPSTPFFGPVERRLGINGHGRRIQFLPAFFHQYPDVLANQIGFDTFALQVSPMDNHGYFSVGTGHDYASQMIHRVGRVIVEVNRQMPRTFGDGFLHVSQVAAIVENDSALPEFHLKPASDVDRAIARHVIELIPDGATIQMGLGSVPDAVCQHLENHRDLGVHGELISAALGRLLQSGAVTNKHKVLNRYKSVFTLILADRATYDFVDDNPAVEGYSVDYVNNPAVIAQFDNFVSVNGLMQVDLTGQVNSEMVDHQQYSSVGGQADYIRGARASKGGKSILVTRSTAANGKASKIVASLDGAVSDTRMDTQYVATEYGIVNLLGKSTTERALALIEIAHPTFRQDLLDQAKEIGIVP
jgi:itaconate CoA-transferase